MKFHYKYSDKIIHVALSHTRACNRVETMPAAVQKMAPKQTSPGTEYECSRQLCTVKYEFGLQIKISQRAQVYPKPGESECLFCCPFSLFAGALFTKTKHLKLK
jgi:hypothetical protein